MVRVIHWKATKSKDGMYTAECYEHKDCKTIASDYDDLLGEIENQSKAKMGSCKVIITYYFDIK